MTQQFNSGRVNAAFTLSGANLVATINTAVNDFYSVYCTETFSTGKYYWEVVCAPLVASIKIGVGNTSASVASGDYLGVDTNSISLTSDTGTVFYNAASQATLQTWVVDPSTICVALDLTNGKIWWRTGAAGNWNNAAIGSQNPATNTGGQALNSVTASAVSPGITLIQLNDAATMNFATSSWVGTAPSGFGPFDPAAGNNDLIILAGGPPP